MIYIMQRTQIYLEKNLHNDLKVGASLMNITISDYIRRILSEKIYQKKFNEEKKPMKHSLTTLAKKGIRLGHKNLARNFDAYLEESLL